MCLYSEQYNAAHVDMNKWPVTLQVCVDKQGESTHPPPPAII